jgi:hypothetical protein
MGGMGSRYENIPQSLMVFLEKQVDNSEIMERIDKLCKHKLFRECEDTQLSMQRGLEKFGGDELGMKVIEHAINQVENCRQLAKIFSYTEFLDFDEYDFEAKGYAELGMSLANRARKNALPLLELPQKTMYYLFERVHEIESRVMDGLNSLSAIYASDFPEEIPILREIADKVFKNTFKKWRYSHDKAGEQLKVLGDKIESWRNNRNDDCVRESDDIADLMEFGMSEGREHIDCLPAYVGDANKKLIQVLDAGGNLMGRSVLRLCNVNNMPMLFVEKPYSLDWQDGYSKAVMESVFKKARDVNENIMKEIMVGASDDSYIKSLRGLEGEVKKLDKEIVLPESINPFEYSDGLGGRLKSGSKVSLEDVVYVMFCK